MVNSDCSSGFYCFSRLQNGGLLITCPDGQIVEFDTETFTWMCTDNLESCPGLGGYTYGTVGQVEITTPAPPSTTTTTAAASTTTAAPLSTTTSPANSTSPVTCDLETINPLGECVGCSGQVFVSHDCTEVFQCSGGGSGTGDGCLARCSEGERVNYDAQSDKWSCEEQGNNYVCPGAFQTDCSDR